MVRLFVVISALAAFVLGGAILLAAPASKAGLWDYTTAFQVYRTAMGPKELGTITIPPPAMIAAVLSFIGMLISVFTGRWRLVFFALLATAVAVAGAYIPLKFRELAQAYPFIHDITTDFENPPAIIAAAELPRKNPPEYVGDEPAPREADGVTTADAQRAAFPDIQPLIYDADLEQVTDAVRAIIKEMNMEILAEGPVGEASGSGWRLEAAFTSTWFGFVDDFIVRLSPSPDGKTRVDVRSKSRVGGSDLGANAERIRAFSAKLNEALGGQ